MCYYSMVFYLVVQLGGFLLLPTQEDFNEYITGAYLGLEFQEIPKTFQSTVAQNVPFLSKGFHYPFSARDRNNFKRK